MGRALHVCLWDYDRTLSADRVMAGVEDANAFLGHLEARAFSPATVRAYAFDLLDLARFLEARRLALGDLVATDILLDRPAAAGPGADRTVGAFVSRPVPHPHGSTGGWSLPGPFSTSGPRGHPAVEPRAHAAA